MHCLHFIEKNEIFIFIFDRFIFLHFFNDVETVMLFFVFVNLKKHLEILSEI